MTRSLLRSTIAAASLGYPMLSSLALGCGGVEALDRDTVEREATAEPENDVASASLALCDGSDDIRFAYAEGLGARQPLLVYGAAYAARYVAIDGHCSFWIYDMTLQGLRSGALDPEYANGQLAQQLHLGAYADIVQPYDACLDGGGEWASDTTGSIFTTCGHGFQGDHGPFAEAFTRAEGLLTELAPLSAPAWDRVYLLPLRGGPRPAAVPLVEWKGELDLGSYAVSYADYSSGVDVGAGLLVHDAPTLAVLRELRVAGDQIVRANPSEFIDSRYPGVFISDPGVGELQVLLRDVPSSAILRAIHSVGALTP